MEIAIIVILSGILFIMLTAIIMLKREKTELNSRIENIRSQYRRTIENVIAVEIETLHVDFFFHGRKSPIRQSFTDVYTVNEDSGQIEVTAARDKLEKFLSDDMLRFGLGKELSIYTSVDCRLFPKSSLKEYKTSYNYKEDMINVFVLKGNKWEQLHYDCWKDSHDFKK